MEDFGDFLVWLGPDISTKILALLDNPSDLIRTSSLSHSWHHFVVGNGFCKKLCIRMFPEVSYFTHVIEVRSILEPRKVRSNNSVEWESLEKDHRVYAHLAQWLISATTRNDCIESPICASSTDNDPEESIENTLDPRERVRSRSSYWSSTGQNDPDVPETLTYKLRSQLCVVDVINIRPFEASFQPVLPIYSSKAVRFKMGHFKSPLDMRSMGDFMEERIYNDDDYIWTYVSPIFPMAQENSLQTFKLPKPVVCIGGILQIELLCRVQKQEMDDLYYICVCHVEVIGRPLPPIFDVDSLNSCKGKNFILKYYPDAEECPPPSNESQDDGPESPSWQEIQARRITLMRDEQVWNRVMILDMMPGNAAGSDSYSDEELMDNMHDI